MLAHTTKNTGVQCTRAKVDWRQRKILLVKGRRDFKRFESSYGEFSYGMTKWASERGSITAYYTTWMKLLRRSFLKDNLFKTKTVVRIVRWCDRRGSEDGGTGTRCPSTRKKHRLWHNAHGLLIKSDLNFCRNVREKDENVSAS